MARLLCNRADTIPVDPPKKVNFNSNPLTTTRLFCKKKTGLAIFLLSLFFSLPLHAVEIIVTLPPLAGLVLMLDKDAAPECLLSAGGDPHHFQLSPRQVERLRASSLLIRSSRDDEGWIKLDDTPTTLNLSSGLDHAWLNPTHVKAVLPKLARLMIAIYPERQQIIVANLPKAMKQASNINLHLITDALPMLKQGVIMQHPAWQKTFTSLGVPVLHILESNKHGHEHGPKHLEEALKTLEKHPDAVLIGDVRHSNRSLEWLASHSNNKKILFLDALGSCGDSWADLMQQNISRISAR
jgi:ABC-type Zn uptake system ZnuABC Zn-binding protein ZnuA